MITDSVAAGLAAVLGLVFGSLASALSYRLPRGLPVAADRSRCTACGTALTPRDLVPLFSWLVSGGRCRHCHRRISWRYPAIEAVTGLLFVAAWERSGGEPIAAMLLAMTLFALVVIAVADLEEGIIPDAMLILLAPLALAWRASLGWDWLDIGLGGLFGLTLSLGLRWAFRRLRGIDALGLGDVKFMGVAGLYVGLAGIGKFLLGGGLAGLVLGIAWRLAGGGRVFPFAPALCAVLAIMLLAPSLVGG